VARPLSRILKVAVIVAVVCAAGAVSASWWLPALGQALVYDDGPGPADIAVVLAGDGFGGRILAAADLVRRHYVPVVLVSGPSGNYGFYENDLAIPFAVKRGCPMEWFIGWPHWASSTYGEAHAVLPELRRRGVHRYLLVTSNHHTRRARYTFLKVQRELGIAMDLGVVAAPDKYFSPQNWWRKREGRKIFFFESTKTVASWLGL
jgi:uncharacterized SAM-binding protein YcdF (DUF218 family)